MCNQCGMNDTRPPKYHPYAACLMMRGAGNGTTVEANLRGVVEYGMKAQARGVSLDDAMQDIGLVSNPKPGYKCKVTQNQVKREPLAEGREHLTVNNKFQSDKYSWCPAGFVPIKVTDPLAMDLLYEYADRRRVVDAEFTRDLNDALLAAPKKKQKWSLVYKWMKRHERF